MLKVVICQKQQENILFNLDIVFLAYRLQLWTSKKENNFYTKEQESYLIKKNHTQTNGLNKLLQ